MSAESLIFVNKEVKEMTDEEITELLIQFPSYDAMNPSSTIKRSKSGYTFLNFNFKT